jgi:hypothetical protein
LKPARRHHRAEARDGQQAETGEQSGARAHRTADARTGRGPVHVIDVFVLGADMLIGDNADVVARYARLLDGIDGRAGMGVAVISSAYGLHVGIPRFLGGY